MTRITVIADEKGFRIGLVNWLTFLGDNTHLFYSYTFVIGGDIVKSLLEWRGDFQECLYSFRIIEPHETYRLEALYCTLDPPARRRRFCAGVSNASIRPHCESLAAKHALVIGVFQSNRMDAAIEILPLSSAWEEAEIAITNRINSGRQLEPLLLLAAKEAQRKACATLLVVLDGEDPALPHLLATVGEVEIDGDTAQIDISSFVWQSVNILPKDAHNRAAEQH